VTQAGLTAESSGARITRPGSVVLEIGGDVGAVVVTVPKSLEHCEVEYRRASEPWSGSHVGITAAEMPGGLSYAAIIFGLTAGSYRLRLRSGHPDESGPGYEMAAEVVGGRVTKLDWANESRPEVVA
jgi:hypothetical protein